MFDPFLVYENLKCEILNLLQYFYGFKISVKRIYFEDKIEIKTEIVCRRCKNKAVYSKKFQSKNVLGLQLRNFALNYMLRDFFHMSEENYEEITESILVKSDKCDGQIIRCVKK